MKKIFEATYIYAILIFIGYYNIQSYYKCFDLEIVPYLTSGELLLSFLPLTLYLLGFSLFIIFFFIRIVTEKALGISPIQTNIAEYTGNEPLSLFTLNHNYTQLKQLIKDKSWKSVNEKFFFFFNFIMVLLGISLFVFFIGYFLHFLRRVGSVPTIITSTILELFIFGLLWFLLFGELLNKTFKERRDLLNLVWFILLIIYSIGLIRIGNHEKAEKILKGNSNSYCEFEYNNSTIKTDTNFVFIGKTENYLFLRSINEEKNFIYPVSEIGRIIYKKSLLKKK